ncbi:prepilin-type N-terminal cleavage/methylation domain-containing protein [Patescibacteria group bacterium]|nr:prepilin-type N-terminal cleavage/methylation domain-containing protein [Patescibacteria group bacterium]
MKQSGFSLVEIMISVAILAMLMVVSYMVMPSLINRAYDARRKADLQKIKTYLESYYSDAGTYPRELPNCGQPLEFNQKVVSPIIPCDPVSNEPYVYHTKGGEPQSFQVYTLLTYDQDESIKLVGCEGGCGPDCIYNYGISSTNAGLVRCSYVCAPGGGKLGDCELFNDPSMSQCPKLYGRDSTCNLECGNVNNRCKNASGKNIPN